MKLNLDITSPDKEGVQQKTLVLKAMTNTTFGPHMGTLGAKLPPNCTELRCGCSEIDKIQYNQQQTKNI